MSDRSRVCLVFFLRGEGGSEEVLLGHKRRGFGTGKVVGIGGHLEPGETAAQAACREAAEECGFVVAVDRLHPAGQVEFAFPARPEWDMVADLFVTRQWSGELTASEEIEPLWHPVADLPWARMWDDSRIWLPPVLRGEYVTVRVAYDPTSTRLADATLHAAPAEWQGKPSSGGEVSPPLEPEPRHSAGGGNRG